MPPDASTPDHPPSRYRVFRFGTASFDEGCHELRVDGAVRGLEPKPRALLMALLAQPKVVVSKKELIQSVWPERRFVEDGSLATAVYSLRAALGPQGHAIVQSVTGMGYRITVPVELTFVDAPLEQPLLRKTGERIPGRAQWQLERPLSVAPANDVWLAHHDKTLEKRIFKFASTPERLDDLKREVALSRVLQAKLGRRDDIVPISEWNFEEPPYFIEAPCGGVNLPDWLESVGGAVSLSLSARVDLIAQVACAVGDAHDAGVIHGDLKPANILVAEAKNGTPRTRLVDFGSGALTEAARAEAFTRTLSDMAGHETGGKSGTYLYMAPEILLGGARTAAADVYSLGILLYQMIVGDLNRPLAAGWERDVSDELLRHDISDAAAGDLARRLDSAKLLKKRLETLDARRADAQAASDQALLAAALEAEHEQLRRTAELRRLEASHAVHLARRTRLAAAGMLVLFLGASATAIYARHQQRTALLERDRANNITHIAEETVAGLIEDVAQGVKARSVLTDADLQKLLERAESTITEMSTLSPEAPHLRRLEARTLTKFGDTRLHEGDLVRALSAVQRAIDLQQALLFDDPRNVGIQSELAESLRWLGDILLKQHNHQAAMDAYKKVLATYERLSASDTRNPELKLHLARAYEAIGDVFMSQHNPNSAFPLYKTALAITTTGLAANGASADWQLGVSEAQEVLGDALEATGNNAAALAAYRSDLEIRKHLYDIDHTNMRMQRNMSVAYADVGDEQKALSDFKGALLSYKTALALDQERLIFDPLRAQWQTDVAVSDCDIAETLAVSGDQSAAIIFFERSISILRGVHQRDPSDTEFSSYLVESEVGIADSLVKLGRMREAEPFAVNAFELARGMISANHDDADANSYQQKANNLLGIIRKQ